MPELPEVETAVRELRAVAVGRRVTLLALRHPALARRVTPAALRAIVGRRIERVERRGKHQLLHLDDGGVVHVHFRMSGDWVVLHDDGDAEPRSTRALLALDDGSRVALVDPRALATIELFDAGAAPELALGPEPDDRAFTAAALGRALARRRGPIKPALLDQRVVAGVGNIYAAEALWRAKLSPLAPAAGLSDAELARLVRGIRAALRAGARRPGRYSSGEAVQRLAVYDREGKPCRRCRTTIERIVQAGRSTWFCPRCQPKPRARRRA